MPVSPVVYELDVFRAGGIDGHQWIICHIGKCVEHEHNGNAGALNQCGSFRIGANDRRRLNEQPRNARENQPADIALHLLRIVIGNAMNHLQAVSASIIVNSAGHMNGRIDSRRRHQNPDCPGRKFPADVEADGGIGHECPRIPNRVQVIFTLQRCDYAINRVAAREILIAQRLPSRQPGVRLHLFQIPYDLLFDHIKDFHGGFLLSRHDIRLHYRPSPMGCQWNGLGRPSVPAARGGQRKSGSARQICRPSAFPEGTFINRGTDSERRHRRA